jgi:hypothetical protein
MKTEELKRNFNDFKKEINELQSYDDGHFEYKSIDSLKAMYEAVRGLCSEWRYLEDSIDDAIRFIEDIEE